MARVLLVGADLGVDPRLAGLFGAFFFSLLTTPLVIAALRWVRLMDHPNERSSHTKATVRGAGWGVLFGTLVGWLGPDLLGPVRWWLPLSAVTYGLIGFVDDLRSLPAGIRFGLQILVSGAALAVGLAVDVVDLAAWIVPVGAVAIVAYVNAFNFMDGVNGISGMQAAVVGGLIAAAAHRVDALSIQIGAIAIAGAALGFLPFNAVRARCFLGDVGSYFIGAWIAMLCVLAYATDVGLLPIASAMAVYGVDTASTLVRRVRRGERWWTAHREHVYQRLTDLGLSHLGSSLVVSCFTALTGAIGVVAAGASAAVQVAAGLVVGAVCAGYLALPRILMSRRPGVRRDGPGLIET